MRAKWRKKRVRRLKRKRRKMRARSKQLASTRSQPSSTMRTKSHDNNKTNPPAHTMKLRVWHIDKGRFKLRTVGQSPSSGKRKLFTQHGLWAGLAFAAHGQSMKEYDSRRSLLGS
ncbi:hypothetical protein F4680DRAFT_326078 [Xylaria scruposa]|nr:hypothetical protein F4680DRAFT_326078 [Xylaria scruposa]